jgi:hypothetical protein
MTRERLMSLRTVVAATALGVGLMLTPASRALEGDFSLSIERDTTVEYDSNRNSYRMTVSGSLTCPSPGQAIQTPIHISVQVIQFHAGEDFDTASGFTPKPTLCRLEDPSATRGRVHWNVEVFCIRGFYCNQGIKAGTALAVATALGSDGKIAQATSDININSKP